jgi:D-glycero-D-manno-heptose 1,7-bisphosphate phosphatase
VSISISWGDISSGNTFMLKERAMRAATPAIFLDRDNTLVVDRGYTYRIEDFQWVPGAPAALKRFCAAQIPIFVITNQGGIGLGVFTEADLQQFHQHLSAEAQKIGAKIIDIAYCVHHPDSTRIEFRTPCRCRKPEPGMIIDLAKKWGISLPKSVVIGDRKSDIEAGERAGCCSYLFNGNNLDLLAQEVLKTHFSK